MTDKKTRKKPVKMPLTDFLTTTPSTSSWADEVLDLPTAPASAYEEISDDRGDRGDRGHVNRSYSGRADRYSDRGYTRQPRPSGPLPDNPPFTAYVGNLPYDLEEADIEEFFTDTKIVNIRIIRDIDGRPKGFGYVEFKDRESLSLAIGQDGKSIRNRSIRVNVAEPPREKHNREDRTNTETWRRRAESPRNSTFSERNDSGRGNRGFDHHNRGHERSSNNNRGFERTTSGNRNHERTPNDGRGIDRAPSSGRGFERVSNGGRGFNHRNNAPDSQPDEPDRADSASTWRRKDPIEPATPTSPSASGGGERRRLGWGFYRSESGGQPTGDDNHGGRGHNSGHGRGNFREDRTSSSGAGSGERKRLTLKPRTIGTDSNPSVPAVSSPLSSPFGNAKPRDENEMQRRVEERRRLREAARQMEAEKIAAENATKEKVPPESTADTDSIKHDQPAS